MTDLRNPCHINALKDYNTKVALTHPPAKRARAKRVKKPKLEPRNFVVELTVTDDSNITIFQQTYKMLNVQRLHSLCNVARVMSRRQFEKECGENKEVTVVGG